MILEPKEHHKLITNHIVAEPRSAIFAGCGLGKTASTLTAFLALRELGEVKGLVVVAPMNPAVMAWPEELDKWDDFAGLNVVSMRTKEGKSAWDAGSADVYIINYEMLPRFVKESLKGRKEIPADMIVFDESQHAKNWGSKRINALRPYLKHFERRVILTGTPLPKGYMDIFAQIRLLDDGERLGNYITHFRRKHFYNPDGRGFTWSLLDGAQEKIEKLIADITLVLKSEDYTEIPEVEEHIWSSKLTSDEAKEYKELKNEFLLDFDDLGNVTAKSAANLGDKLRQFSSGALILDDGGWVETSRAKMQSLHDLLAMLMKQGQGLPALLVTHYVSEKERVLEEIDFAVEFSKEIIPEWNEGKVPLMVANYRQIAEGLNLQKGGSTVIWFSPNHAWDKVHQTNSRLARSGQKHRTDIYNLVVDKTLDRSILEVVRQKQETENAFKDALQIYAKAKI